MAQKSVEDALEGKFNQLKESRNFSWVTYLNDFADDEDGLDDDDDENALEEGKQEDGNDESPGEIISMQDLEQMGFNIANYSSEDMASLTQITTEMNRRMQIARGMKRGRKVQGFADYCKKTTDRINELKAELNMPTTTEDKKKQLRNQISAFQARLKQRITNMDQELRLEQKNQQLSTILSVVKAHVEPDQLNSIFEKIDETFQEMDLYNSPAFKQMMSSHKNKGGKRQR